MTDEELIQTLEFHTDLADRARALAGRIEVRSPMHAKAKTVLGEIATEQMRLAMRTFDPYYTERNL